MSFSGSLQLDHVQVSATADSIQARAADMASRRATIEDSVESLLSVWYGDAATRFASLWAEWRDSADAVITSLDASVGAVRAARDDVTSADSHAGDTSERLRGRLG